MINDMSGLITPNIKDKNGVDVLLGNIVRYYDLYECHSDAVDYFDVEPQNNFPVDEVFIEVKEGIVTFDRCAFRVDGVVISDLGCDITSRVMDMHYRGDLGAELNEFISENKDRLQLSRIKQVKQIEVLLKHANNERE